MHGLINPFITFLAHLPLQGALSGATRTVKVNKVRMGSTPKIRIKGADLLLLSSLHVFKHLDNVITCRKCIFFHHTMGVHLVGFVFQI